MPSLMTKKASSPLGAFLGIWFTHSTSEQGLLLPDEELLFSANERKMGSEQQTHGNTNPGLQHATTPAHTEPEKSW